MLEPQAVGMEMGEESQRTQQGELSGPGVGPQTSP